jgi:hypothetical protein
MKKIRKPTRENVTPMQERDLSLAKGMAEAAQHVDNPGQTPMKDGPG